MAVGTIPEHFPTKIGLVASVVSEVVAQVADRIDETPDLARFRGVAWDNPFA